MAISVEPDETTRYEPYLDQQFANIWPRGFKTFFMLNSDEHEIFSASKYENANNSWHFRIY